MRTHGLLATASALLLGVLTTPARADILYVGNAGNNTIEKFNAGGVASIFADGTDGLSAPSGLAFDSLGNLYTANRGNHTIERFSPGGIGSLFANDRLGGLRGLAFDS